MSHLEYDAQTKACIDNDEIKKLEVAFGLDPAA
jgi:hypothetical protein